MRELILVTGGCKSGKSRHALNLAERFALRKIFIATCNPFDEEMKQRVARHKQERNDSWQTLDVPVRLPEAISDYAKKDTVLLIDCLTLWINNLLLIAEDPDGIHSAVERLIQAANIAPCPVIIVSNEVGAGIVPENRLARLFRDIAGISNQQIAAAADRVICMMAGLPLTLKETRCG
ncbi:MAG: bifunctional adenosylcobinamide kinase/adenosylcobinamide-phosphate guanylyltransferase [Desulfobacterales bacterium]|nr:bifunctional adenosylcobinamide kinase/adenosylcobinamide-phosphate guanylyltransferase [Desulfobacterales bacterium]